MPEPTQASAETHTNIRHRFGLIKLKIVLLFIVVGSIPSIVIGVYAIHKQSRMAEHEVIRNHEDILSRKVQDVEIFRQQCEDDLREIRGRFSVRALVTEISAQKNKEKIEFWTDLVQQDFSRFADIRKCYAQVQLIDSNGKEHIRMDTAKGKSVIRLKRELRNLADKPYFTRVLSLERDEFTVLPHLATTHPGSKDEFTVPTICFGMPLTTHDGRKMGILVLSAFAESFLGTFSEISTGQMVLIDSSGDILYPPRHYSKNPKQNKTKEEFKPLYSETIWDDIRKTGSGTIRSNPDGIVSYRKIDYRPNDAHAFWIAVYSSSLHAADHSEAFKSMIDFKNNLAVMIGIFLILVLIMAFLFGERLTRRLHNIVGVAKAITKGDLEQRRLDFHSNDEIGILAESLDTMINRLRNNILSTTSTATDIAGSSSELSAAVQEQSAITAQQSASLTEITATLEELTTSSSQIAENSNSVVEISAFALGESEKGMTDIKMIQKKMNEIAEDNRESTDEIVELGKKSKEIGKVMEIINTIADQTKLIAFNAAIEAASAGESGRRFEVVASEIRRLADSVMSSTEEIEETIAEIRRAINRLVLASERGANRIKEGTALATKTFGQLEQLVSGAKSTNDASAQISLSTQQQKSATNQVLNALKEIEQGFLEIAASIHQTSGISQELSGSSTALKELVSEYKVNASARTVDST